MSKVPGLKMGTRLNLLGFTRDKKIYQPLTPLKYATVRRVEAGRLYVLTQGTARATTRIGFDSGVKGGNRPTCYPALWKFGQLGRKLQQLHGTDTARIPHKLALVRCVSQ